MIRHYTRFPKELGLPRTRLSDDPDEAERESRSILASSASRSDIALYMKRLITTSRSRARLKGWAYDLKEDRLLAMLAEQKGLCAVSGLPFDLSGDVNEKFLRPFAPSLDRVDSRSGYVPSNVRLVCRIVNYGMGPWGYEALRTVAHAIARLDPPADAKAPKSVSKQRCHR
ncbi:hypothetical protein [Methylobacterium sp. R2-1]|uniref:hypothetical protein n=1 Tax=Methylobacterium sp. R2-1 TaxID=2587064 RepID=UPI0016114361|nr:hypothetical protein [Methylobacterium sp. R2-1]MBB2964933.1 hypothetical protein [Methylobacterium sp. R2-1]